MGAVVDVDLEGDHRQPVAEARPEGGREEQAEPSVSQQRTTIPEARSGHGLTLKDGVAPGCEARTRSRRKEHIWQAYTADGRLLILRRTESSGWLAICLSKRAESPTAMAAIRRALGAPLDGRVEALEAWIADHVAELDSAGEPC
jgi:hypothetical protein